MPTTRKSFIQQSAFALAGTCLPFSKLFAGSPAPPHVNTVDTQHPKDCTKNLNIPLYSASAITYADFLYHKGTYPGIIEDVVYPAETNVGCCVDLSRVTSVDCLPTNDHDFANPQQQCGGNPQPPDPANNISNLRYRAFYPISSYVDPVNGHDYENYPLPCVILFHPGGFQECIDHLLPGMITICQQLARRGYIAITANYRAGRLEDNPLSGRTTAQQQLAVYRAIQDGRGVIRSVIKRNGVNKHGNRFKINADQFFVGGLSAGAIVALGISYYRTQAMINAASPVQATSPLTIQQALGHMNADYYYGETGSDSDNPNYWPVIRGVLNCWGSITIPKSFDGTTFPDNGASESAFFAGTGDQINPPIIGFFGKQDTTIYPEDDDSFQKILNSNTPPFKQESLCLAATSGYFLIKNPGTNNVIFTKICSAQNMYYNLKVLNRFTELYEDCDMGHGIQNYLTDNFDVNATSDDDVQTYIAIRAAVFFQTIMNVPVTAAFPPFGYRGKSLFISTDADSNNHVINTRTCSQCDGIPASDVCDLPDDPTCP